MRIGGALLLTLVLALTGCSSPSPQNSAQLGCDNADQLLPMIDEVHNGGEATREMSDDITASIYGDIYDEETLSSIRLLGEEVRDQFAAGYTIVEVDHEDIRERLVSYCHSVGWRLANA